jgi:hypothetical protein
VVLSQCPLSTHNGHWNRPIRKAPHPLSTNPQRVICMAEGMMKADWLHTRLEIEDADPWSQFG